MLLREDVDTMLTTTVAFKLNDTLYILFCLSKRIVVFFLLERMNGSSLHGIIEYH